MTTDTITLVVNGEVSLEDFSRAMDHFAGLVSGLTAELGGGVKIDWVVAELESGSAVATIRGPGEGSSESFARTQT